MRNTDPHQKWTKRKPPSIGPMATPSPAVAGPDPDGAGSLSICREHVGQDRQRGGHQGRRPHSHDRPGPDEPVRRARPRRQGRPAPEDDEATHEDPLAPYPITECSEAQQQTSEEDRKGIDDPLQLGRGRVQVADDRRQGHVENRVVEADQQQGDAQNGQGHPAPGAGHGDALSHGAAVQSVPALLDRSVTVTTLEPPPHGI